MVNKRNNVIVILSIHHLYLDII